MNSSLLAIRAIASEFANRIYRPIGIIVAIVSFLLIVIMIWLVTVSAWWWLLAVPIFVLILVAMLLVTAAGVIIRVVSPKPTKTQKAQVSQFVDKLQRLSEITATPKAFILFRSIKDAVSPSRNGYVQSIVTDSTSLQKDFKEILASFARKQL